MNMQLLQKSYLLVPIAVLLSVLLTFSINLMAGHKDEKNSYIKSALITAITSGIIVYIHKINPSLEEIISTPVPF
jgi:hypothetical protein